MPRRFGFGLGFNLNRLTGLPEPSGFVAKYLSYYIDDFTLVTGSNVSQWDDISANANHLTQGTSTNQPVLTQDANQFNNTVDFGTDDYMIGLPLQSGDFTYVLKGLNLPTDTGSSRVFLSNPSESNSLFYVVGASDKFAVRDITNTINEFNKVIDYGVAQTVVLTRSGNLYSLYVNGVFQDSITITAGLTGFTALGRDNPSFDGSLQELYVFDRALTQDEINWFSYLRNDQNEILRPPLLPS